MPFVSTGFPALNRMLAGNGECAGFPRGSLTILVGGTGSGKSRLMRECCSRAHNRGLRVVYLDTESESEFEAEYPTRFFMTSLDEVENIMANLLHPGRENKTDLLVLDCVTRMTSRSDASAEAPPQLGTYSLQLGRLFRRSIGQTAVVCTVQSRRTFNTDASGYCSEMGYQASGILSISHSNSVYNLELTKSKISTAGVSCEIRLDDPEKEFDRSVIKTRYQRILRGGY